MRNILQITAGVAVAGAVAAGSTALTGTGLGVSGLASSAQVVGGSITQNVSGAVLSDIVYGFADSPAKTQVNTVTLTFTAGNGRTVALTAAGTGFGGGSPAADMFYCPATISGLTMACTATDAGTHAGTGGYYTGLTAMTVTVS